MKTPQKTINMMLDVVSSHPNADDLFSFAIDTPRAQMPFSQGKFPLEGWVLGKHSRAIKIEALAKDSTEVIQAFPINHPRPDVAHVHPQFPEASCSGFKGVISMSSFGEERNIVLQVLLNNGKRVVIGAIKVLPIDQIDSSFKGELNAQKNKNVILPSKNDMQGMRVAIAQSYLRGEGIEIGALHSPLQVPSNLNIRYVDRMSVSDLRQQYPELADKPLVNVDIVDDGETLKTIQDNSQNFVIANHFLEHCQNPILAIENMLRVLKPSGILYLAVPDKRYTFDKDRPVTNFQHALKDYQQGPSWSRTNHFEEWVHFVDNVREPESAKQRVKKLLDMDYSIHYHVWTLEALLRLILNIPTIINSTFEIKFFVQNKIENIIILAKG